MDKQILNVCERLNRYISKTELYFKVGLIKLFKEKFDSEMILDSTRKYRIRNIITKDERSYLCIFYQCDQNIGIKCAIFVDKMTSEFNIVFDKYETHGPSIFDMNCSSNDVNLLEDILCMKDNFETRVGEKTDETKVSKIHLLQIIHIFSSKVIISLFTKLNQLYALYGDNDFTFLGYDISACYISLFAYLYYKNHKNRNGNIVSFGMPRYGNMIFKENYNSLENMNHLNIINKRDNVCAYPLIDYHHVGTILFFEENDTLNTIQAYSRFQYLWRMSILYCNNSDHHRLESYLRSIVTNKQMNYIESKQSISNYQHSDPYYELDGDYIGN